MKGLDLILLDVGLLEGLLEELRASLLLQVELNRVHFASPQFLLFQPLQGLLLAPYVVALRSVVPVGHTRTRLRLQIQLVLGLLHVVQCLVIETRCTHSQTL